MNLLHIISSMNPQTGGPCQGIINLYDGLTELGINQEIVCLDNPDATYIRQSLLPIHTLGSPQSSWQYNTHLYPWLQANIDRFDVIILHGLWLYLGFAIYRALAAIKKKHRVSSRKVKIPKFFIFPHGMLDPWFQKNPQRQFKAIRNTIYWFLIEHKIINSADGLLFTCETELLLAKEPFLQYAPKRETNIGYGIAEPPHQSEAINNAFYKRFPHLRHEQYLLYLGRIHAKKGVDLLVQAYEDLLTNNHLTKTTLPKLVIAGPGLDSAYGKNIQQKVKRSPLLIENITFTGMIVDEVKWGAFYNAEAFILPSYQENFGIAVVESLACGKAVLISNQVNIWREIETSNAGIIFNNSVNDIRRAIEKFLTMNESSKNHINQCALTTYRTSFSAKPIAKKLAEAISI